MRLGLKRKARLFGCERNGALRNRLGSTPRAELKERSIDYRSLRWWAFTLCEKTGWTPVSLSMLLASSRQKPIHGGMNVSPKLSVARRKGSGFALIGLSGALEGYRARRRGRNRSRPTANPKGSQAAICFQAEEIMHPTRQGSPLGSECPAPCGFR